MKKILFALTLFILSFPAIAAEPKESAYDRVIRTNTLRCGYIVWPPYMTQDTAEGTFSGMNYDYAEAVAATLGLKIDWAEEISPGSQVEALRSGKIDAICTAEGPIVPSTIKFIAYSTPMAYVPFYLYARAGDHRFDGGLETVNDPAIRMAVIDGDVSGQTAAIQFPKAARVAIPQLASPTQIMLDVATGKADVLLNDPVSMRDYMDANPGKLRKVGPAQPVTVVPNTFSTLRGTDQRELLELLNQAIDNVKDTGVEQRIFAKYPTPGETPFYPTAQPYRLPR